MVLVPRRDESSFYTPNNGCSRGHGVLRKQDGEHIRLAKCTPYNCERDNDYPVG